MEMFEYSIGRLKFLFNPGIICTPFIGVDTDTEEICIAFLCFGIIIEMD